jgi:hypothetical protein
MKKVKISLDDLLVVLEAMKDSAGTKDIMFFEFNGMPAICDAEDPDNIITFQAVSETGEVDTDEETIH